MSDISAVTLARWLLIASNLLLSRAVGYISPCSPAEIDIKCFAERGKERVLLVWFFFLKKEKTRKSVVYQTFPFLDS